MLQVTTLLGHVEEVAKAELPDQAQLDTLRSNTAKQQQKVDQLTAASEPASNGAQVGLAPMHWGAQSALPCLQHTGMRALQ